MVIAFDVLIVVGLLAAMVALGWSVARDGKR
jgi:hypothetical protein